MEDWSRGVTLVETLPTSSEVQRTIERAAIWAPCIALDTEEIFEEMKQRLECQVDQMYKPRLGKAAVGKTLYPRLRCRKRSIYGKVSGIWYGLEFVLVWILMNFGQMKCHETTPGNPTDITAA